MKSITRRSALKLFSTSTLVASGGLGLTLMPRTTFGQPVNPSNGVLVVIFQRGGNDGINTLVPIGSTDYNYYKSHRNNLALSELELSGTIVTHSDKFLNNTDFAVHPALGKLKDAWQSNHLTFYPATHVGTNGLIGSLSHFDAQEIMEYGGGGNSLGNINSNIGTKEPGWIARALKTNGTNINAFGFAKDNSLKGDGSILVTSDTASFGGIGEVLNARLIERNNNIGDALLRGKEWRDTQNLFYSKIARIGGLSCSGCAGSYSGQLGSQLKQTAGLIQGIEELQVVTINQGGYDTHDNQLSRQNSLLSNLATNLDAFRNDLATYNDKPIEVVVITEFGRTLDENGNAGTDHGQAFCAMAMGVGTQAQAKKNNVILGAADEWLGLEGVTIPSSKRFYIKPIQDYRDILSEVLVNLGIAADDDAALALFQSADSTYNRTNLNIYS